MAVGRDGLTQTPTGREKAHIRKLSWAGPVPPSRKRPRSLPDSVRRFIKVIVSRDKPYHSKSLKTRKKRFFRSMRGCVPHSLDGRTGVIHSTKT